MPLLQVDSDIKLPKLGSSHISGGSGGYGTSNGYNVKYKQSTSPNNNSSLRDYSHTNNQPTEFRNGRNTQPASTNHVDNTSSLNVGNSSSLNSSSTSTIGISAPNSTSQKSKTYYKICDWCKGTGKRNIFEWFYGDELGMGESCNKCGRSDKHRHDEIVECDVCFGKGKIKMAIADGPLGDMEIRVWE